MNRELGIANLWFDVANLEQVAMSEGSFATLKDLGIANRRLDVAK